MHSGLPLNPGVTKGEGRASNYRNLLLKMMTKMLATLKKNVANMTVTVAAAVATLKKVLNMRKVLRRLISPAEIVEKLAS
jgi:hypothetical protein